METNKIMFLCLRVGMKDNHGVDHLAVLFE